jgi:hypothetical protein
MALLRHAVTRAPERPREAIALKEAGSVGVKSEWWRSGLVLDVEVGLSMVEGPDVPGRL